MKIDDLLLLLKAGYTKADIEALNTTPDQPVPLPAGDDPVQSPDKQDSEPAPETVQPAQPAIDDDRFKKLETKIDYVINRFNYMNARDSQQPEQKTESVDDILAKMIR